MEVPADLAGEELSANPDDLDPPRKYVSPSLPDRPGTPTWILSFTDTMGLLLTFFVMLFCMSSPKQDEDTPRGQSNLPPLLEEYQFQGASGQAGPLDTISVNKIDYNKALDLGYLQNILESFQKKSDLFSRIHLVADEANRRLIVSLPQDLLFSPGKSDLSPSGGEVVRELARTLAHLRNGIEVVGHADPREPSGPKTNWDLSLERAAVVASALRGEGGLAKAPLVKAYSSGLYHVLPDTMPEDQKFALSRRVDVLINEHDGTLQQRFGIVQDSALR